MLYPLSYEGGTPRLLAVIVGFSVRSAVQRRASSTTKASAGSLRHLTSTRRRGWLAPVSSANERALVSIAPSTKEQLVLSAERLFALHGIDGVSLRQVAAEAGAGNNSAVRYHFGSKDGLVEAILMYRLPELTRRRQLLAARTPERDLRSAIEAHFLPVVEQAEDETSYYLTFLEQLQGYSLSEHPFERLPASYRASHADFVKRVGAMLTGIPRPLRTFRVNRASSICLHASADRERARHFGTPVPPFDLYVSELFDGLVGYLEAPISATTLSALKRARTGVAARAVLP
jgi:AcrR family transcriptional regulator